MRIHFLLILTNKKKILITKNKQKTMSSHPSRDFLTNKNKQRNRVSNLFMGTIITKKKNKRILANNNYTRNIFLKTNIAKKNSKLISHQHYLFLSRIMRIQTNYSLRIIMMISSSITIHSKKIIYEITQIK